MKDYYSASFPGANIGETLLNNNGLYIYRPVHGMLTFLSPNEQDGRESPLRVLFAQGLSSQIWIVLMFNIMSKFVLNTKKYL